MPELIFPVVCRLPYAHDRHHLRASTCNGEPHPIDAHDPDALQDTDYERGAYDEGSAR